ncbi:UNVERIFIED_CONTAM: hypothetical protein Slati_3911700 [Sesamum latifolium]|uniref:Uncharacterized protein n=1 Tax=Sesamum latifolium TaxID=2727402 RepID=A0AAW2TP50_9LAMI
METNKFKGTNYNDWLRNLRIILDFENQGYDLDKPLPAALPEGSSPKERLTFEKWHEDNRKVRSIIFAWMTNEIQKQYDRLDVPSIMLCMKEVYVVPDRHISMPRQKHSSGSKWPKDRLCRVMGSRCFPLWKSSRTLKLGEASTSKAKGKGARRWKRKKGKGTAVKATASTGGAPAAQTEKGKGKVGGSQRSKVNDVCMHCQGKGH